MTSLFLWSKVFDHQVPYCSLPCKLVVVVVVVMMVIYIYALYMPVTLSLQKHLDLSRQHFNFDNETSPGQSLTKKKNKKKDSKMPYFQIHLVRVVRNKEETPQTRQRRPIIVLFNISMLLLKIHIR